MSADLVPLPVDADLIEQSADPVAFVTLACERAKVWLAQALEHGEIDQIVELKSQAEAIRVYTTQKQLGKDAELAAAEIVRRAERGIGLAIRRGQEEGTIRRQGQGAGAVPPHANQPRRDTALLSPLNFATRSELVGQDGRDGIYAMTDGVPDDTFEQAIEEAKEERNLSRANVVRKVTGNGTSESAERVARARDMAAEGYTSRQIGEAIGIRNMGDFRDRHGIDVPADRVVGKTRRHDSNRIVSETIAALEGISIGLDLIEVDDLDRAKARDWAISLSNSIRSLNRLSKQLKEIAP